MVGNIIPYIGGEEEKSEQEPLKIWGHVSDGRIVTATSPTITAQFIRVPVSDGHMAAVFVAFEKKPTKEQILEAYLNFIHFGSRYYGIESAARHYFGKPAIRLTRYEASLLAAALPNPWRYRVKPPSPYVQQRSAWIRRQMGQLGQVTLNRVHGTE